ncbi:MAG TPA: cytochrome c peroxidase [Longimicrobiales bacterium]|nr:cytochrome c peroxidase [Longimicrobiales bacterium]
MSAPRRFPVAARAAVPVAGLVLTLSACHGLLGADPPTLRRRALDAGLAPMPTQPVRPAEDPLLPERVSLGRLLFFDRILSGQKDVACSTCHLPRFAFTDARQFPVGAGATGLGPARTEPAPPPLRVMPRNAPSVMNVGLYGRKSREPSVNGTMFWGGDAFGIEDQVLAPMAADNEMRGLAYPRAEALDSVLARLRAIPGYVARFAAAYPDVARLYGGDAARLISPNTLRRAIAAYLRELITPDAPIDRFLAGREQALDDAQKRGLDLFIGKAGCVACHDGPLLSDFSMHVLGTPQEGLGRDTTPGEDLGWGEHGGTPYAFRTPPLRQVARTAPYFHAGTAATLEDVLAFKNRGVSARDVVPNTALDTLVRPLGLSAPELADLRAFLDVLTDSITSLDPLFQPPDSVPSGLEVVK